MFRVSVRVAVVCLVAPLVLLALPAAPSAQEPPKKSITEKFEAKARGAVQTIKKGALTAEEAIREQYERARGAVARMGVEARVYARLTWEKALANSKVDISAPSEGVIALNGTVVDDRARAKAVELARDTIGVTKVIDNLVVQTSTQGAVVPKRP